MESSASGSCAPDGLRTELLSAMPAWAATKTFCVAAQESREARRTEPRPLSLTVKHLLHLISLQGVTLGHDGHHALNLLHRPGVQAMQMCMSARRCLQSSMPSIYCVLSHMQAYAQLGIKHAGRQSLSACVRLEGVW